MTKLKPNNLQPLEDDSLLVYKVDTDDKSSQYFTYIEDTKHSGSLEKVFDGIFESIINNKNTPMTQGRELEEAK